MSEQAALPRSVHDALVRLGLLQAGAPYHAEPLAGGVSSDIWKVACGERTFCVKRALARLRVQDEWFAPLGRNATEVAWFELAAAIVPQAVPRVLAHDAEAGVFAMAYLEPASHVLWKAQLRDGVARDEQAAQVAAVLVRLHSATARDASLARRFATDAAFHALRLDAYLLATARRHPGLRVPLEALVADCVANRVALVHGDVSPKNILFGPRGPVFLDAETAWYGDPAFDLAFCLNHLLLKCLWVPAARADLLRCFLRLGDEYLARVDWEPAAALERRVAALLPGLLLARVDGKSPVEYLRPEGQRLVRRFAPALLVEPVAGLAEVAQRWRDALPC